LLLPADNEKITRVGPRTPCGELFRRYWLPAALSEELPDADGAPVRVRLLGENLVAFRDGNGIVGLVDDACPHRRAPMFFGRNEECGLRCVYHGWKFDRHGACTDMPSEPADSLFKTKVRITAYPTWEGGGVVWTYMGPPALQPPPPDYEWIRTPASHRFVSKTYENCNWLQGLEGGIDTAHSSYAHRNDITNTSLPRRDGHPRLEVEKNAYGYRYASVRTLDGDETYTRIYHYVMPAQQMRGAVTSRAGGRAKAPKLAGHLWIPRDDETTYVYNTLWSYDPAYPLSEEIIWNHERECGRGKEHLLPGYKLKADKENDYFIDREVQRTRTYTGIPGINTQDYALQEGMGPICDRSREHLGTSDAAIIAARQLLFEAIDAVARGERPRGVDPAAYREVRPYDDYLRAGRDWRTAFAPELVAKW
jgi:phenylpropionate dioxygenase-like ring-hydroxylating dioxygenase large terminal subunit